MENIEGVVFFDLDGTLLNQESIIEDEVANAIVQLKNNNILPVICTGRSPQEIDQIKKAANIDTAILLNGSLIMDDDNILYEKIIPTETCKAIIELATEHNEAVSMYNANNQYTTIANAHELIASREEIAQPVPPQKEDFYVDNNINMLVAYSKDSASKFQKSFSDSMKFYKTGTYSIDCVVKSASKKHGIIKLIELLKLNNIPSYAFGDGPNDIEMLDYVDHSIVMGNAKPDVFVHGEYTTTANINHGIVNGLKHYNLI